MLISFILFNVLNVIIQTAKSIITIRCNKWIASITNAIAYGLYTYIIILTTCELPLWIKITVVAGANLIGVFVVKYIEEKRQKEKLWKIEFTVDSENTITIYNLLNTAEISFNYIDTIKNKTVFNAFCNTKKESESVKEIIKKFNAKYFVNEEKGIL